VEEGNVHTPLAVNVGLLSGSASTYSEVERTTPVLKPERYGSLVCRKLRMSIWVRSSHRRWLRRHLLHCALASCGAVYCNRSCLWVSDSGRTGGVRTLLQPARARCLRLSGRFFDTSYVAAQRFRNN